MCWAAPPEDGETVRDAAREAGVEVAGRYVAEI